MDLHSNDSLEQTIDEVLYRRPWKPGFAQPERDDAVQTSTDNWQGTEQATVAGYGEPQQRVYLDDHHLVLRWGDMLTVYEVTATVPGSPHVPARVRQLLSFSARQGQLDG